MSEDEPTPIQNIVFNRPLSGLPAHLLLASKHSFALKVLLITHDVIPRFGQFGRQGFRRQHTAGFAGFSLVIPRGWFMKSPMEIAGLCPGPGQVFVSILRVSRALLFRVRSPPAVYATRVGRIAPRRSETRYRTGFHKNAHG